MEAGNILGGGFSPLLRFRSSSTRRPPPYSPCLVNASSSNLKEKRIGSGTKPRRDWVRDWVSRNDEAVRSLPIYVGGSSLVAVLLNRAVSGIPPVADASSSQSRADLLALGLAVTNILTGLVWLSIRPKSITAVDLKGVECRRIDSSLSGLAVSEIDGGSIYLKSTVSDVNLDRAWEALSAATCCRSLVIVYDKKCILQIGLGAETPNNGEAVTVDAAALMQGSICRGVLKSGTQSYLANLALYPGRSELPFLPSNTQAVILQPLGDRGIVVLGGNMIRGFTTSDQAWITYMAEKLDASLAKSVSKEVVQDTV